MRSIATVFAVSLGLLACGSQQNNESQVKVDTVENVKARADHYLAVAKQVMEESPEVKQEVEALIAKGYELEVRRSYLDDSVLAIQLAKLKDASDYYSPMHIVTIKVKTLEKMTESKDAKGKVVFPALDTYKFEKDEEGKIPFTKEESESQAV
jgi:hypothetical protein